MSYKLYNKCMIFRYKGGKDKMPLLQLREVYTPLGLFGIKFYRAEQERNLYIKIGKRKIKKMFS